MATARKILSVLKYPTQFLQILLHVSIFSRMRYRRAVLFSAVVPRDEGSSWALIYQQCRSIRSQNVARVTSSASVSGQGGDCDISSCCFRMDLLTLHKETVQHKQIEYSKYNSRGVEVMRLISSPQACSAFGSNPMIKCFISNGRPQHRPQTLSNLSSSPTYRLCYIPSRNHVPSPGESSRTSEATLENTLCLPYGGMESKL